MSKPKENTPAITHIQASLLFDINKGVNNRLFGLPDWEELERRQLVWSNGEESGITELGKQTCEALSRDPNYSFLA